MSLVPPAGPVVLEPGDSPGHRLAPWFAYWRRVRRERQAAAPRATPARSAVFTIVQDESVFLPIWLRYYSRFFAPEDIYVLDHETTDGSTDRDGFVRVPVSHETFDNRWLVATVERRQRELLERYDVVVFVDVDEIVAPRPDLGTLADYLARFDEEWVNCLGYELLHMPGEPPLDLDRPLLEQRSRWFVNDIYDKPAIASVPLSWRLGFHGRADNHFNGDPDLRLIHLHRADYEICRARHRRWRGRPWNEEDLRAGWGTHNRVAEDAEFARWFYEDSTVEAITIEPEEIPPSWRSVV